MDRWLGALIAGLCGLGIAFSPVGSYASGQAAAHDRDRPTLTGLPMPDLPTTAALAVRSVVVVRGDTLWWLAADRLPASATDVQIATAVDRWYHRNRSVIGRDPDLILPGTRLEQPGGRS